MATGAPASFPRKGGKEMRQTRAASAVNGGPGGIIGYADRWSALAPLTRWDVAPKGLARFQ